MKRRKILNVLFLLVFLASITGGNTSAVMAEPAAQPGGGRPERPERVTQADREAAAQRAEEAGFTLETTATADMNMGAEPRYFSHPNYANSPLPGNIVAEWNAIAQDFLQPAGSMMTMGGVSMSAAFVYLAYMQAAVYDALVAIEGGYTPYNLALLPDPTASREAAVATAAYKVLANYFPLDTTLPVIYADALAAIPDSAAKTAGIAIGDAAAAGIINLRTGDILSGDGGYVVPPPGPGVWEPTVKLPDGSFMPPMDPWMAELKPFLRATPDQYTLIYPPPPDLTDPEYASNDLEYLADFAEVRDWGGAVSAFRTAEQTDIAKFWTTNMVIQTNTAYRNLAETRSLSLLDTARLMAMGNMIATDSLIATFDTKYNYSFWRPVTAIQHTQTDGTYTSTVVNTWMPVVMTPNFPEFMAGHGSFMSAQAELYTQFFGTPQIEVDLMSDATGATRHYAFADDLRTEVINARTWGGMHFRSSTELAAALGQQIVTDALATYFTPNPATDTGQHVTITGGIRKFVNELPVLCDPAAGPCTGTASLGQYLPVAVPDTTTYPGSHYYEIAVVQYREQMHSDLPPTLLRGYVQLSTNVVMGEHVQLTNALLDGTEVDIPGFFGVTPPHYLGPTIVANKNIPVRIKFYNLLPTGIPDDLFLPVDVTVMGAGMGPDLYGMVEDDPQNPMCGMAYDMLTGERIPKPAGCYTENRATLHLHGGISPWISDGTPHQWVTPANETASYPQGVSVLPVPDMSDSGDPGDGVMTFYYTNQQSARLMFYHDHSWGITRLNVYAGGAAPYLITDATEQSLVSQGLIPDAASTIPLVIQDKTFVPKLTQLALEDETWDAARWGGPGGLWLPHVYSPAQNPGDSSGVNQYGRWAYGPWFWPPTTDIEFGPIANPYYDPLCNPDVTWCEPPLMPGTPFNSMGMEAFMDTPIVNGTAYPTLAVDPKTYRFRMLNAANDRFFNLSFYKAVDANGLPCDLANLAPAPSASGLTCTEVALNPDEVAAALDDPTIFPTPLAGTEGPSWIHIGSEGGFLPAPAVVPAHPTTWVNDPTVFNAGNVDLHSLLLAPAERADVIVDFSAFAGQTLILYNDAPAAFPARDPRYDYYTGNGDYRDTGGAPSTLSGYGPNTRTVMQIKVAPLTPQPAFALPALQTAFMAVSLGGQGVFETSQNPILVGQGAYNSAYGTTFQVNGPDAGLVQIFDTSFTFKTLANGAGGDSLTFPLQPKMIQDEMGEAFDHEYGRMSGYLGVETANAQAGLQNMILYPYLSPPTEVLKGVQVPMDASGELLVEPLATTTDGTQIWKITHNGVDTHPIHVHLYDIQLINRVGWDGIIRKPEAGELGWKETVRVSPLEDTIVALRPILPVYPFDLPNSVRLIDPMSPEGVYLANTTLQEALGLPIYAFNPDGEPIDIINHYVNYGAEYVWHCHILSHEEMDMMHAQVVGIAPSEPSGLTFIRLGNGSQRRYELSWTDTSTNETAFVIERRVAGSTAAWSEIAILPSAIFGVVPFVETGVGPGIGTRTYTDRIGNTNTLYEYQVYAVNTVGDVWDYSNPAFNEIPSGGGFPTLTLSSRGDTVIPAIAAPGNLTASAVVKNRKTADVTLNWVDNSDNETGFLVQRSDNATFTLGVVNATVGANITTLTQNLPRARSYYYRVLAFDETTQSGWSNTVNVVTP